jgi:uncharacterized membrane protein
MVKPPSCLRNLVKIFFFALSCILFFFYGQNIPFEKQWPLYDGLRNTSAIIFGVMGAWIALIYPEALSSLVNSVDKSKNLNEVRSAERLLPPLVYSAIILVFVLLVGITAPILKQISFFDANYKVVRGISYALLGSLTICQLWTVSLTLLPVDLFKRNINRLQSRNDARERKFSLTKKISQEKSGEQEEH